MPSGIAQNTSTDRYMSFLAENVEVSHTYMDLHPIFTQGYSTYYPTVANIDPFTIDFYEDSSFTVYQFMVTWRLLVLDRLGNYGLPRQYKKQMAITLTDISGVDGLHLAFNGVWPLRMPSWRLVSDSSERIHTTVSFSADLGGVVDEISGGTGVGLAELNPSDPLGSVQSS